MDPGISKSKFSIVSISDPGSIRILEYPGSDSAKSRFFSYKKDESRRVAPSQNSSKPSLSGQSLRGLPSNTNIVWKTSHGIAAWSFSLRLPRGFRDEFIEPRTGSPLQPIFWYTIARAAPQCVKVPNL